MENSIYSYMIDFAGGTYVSQVQATSLGESFRQWLANYDFNHHLGLTENQANELVSDLRNASIVGVTDVKNIWCTSALIGKKTFLLNVIKTSSTIEKSAN